MYLRNTLCCFLYFVVNWKPRAVNSLQITNMFVPREASHEALLDCRYSLRSNETLYDVKWYKDGSEFFRCKANGSVQQFAVDGIKLYASEMAQKGSCLMTLTGLNEQSSGEYLCEVSLDFTFQSVTRTSRMNFVLPSAVNMNNQGFIKGRDPNEARRFEMANNVNKADAYVCNQFFIATILFLWTII